MDGKSANSDTRFGIYIHHGGHFGKIGDDTVYAGGVLSSALNLDSETFAYMDLEFEIEIVGYVSWDKLAYKVPGREIYNGVNCDEDVIVMLSYLSEDVRIIHIFVDGGKVGSGNDHELGSGGDQELEVQKLNGGNGDNNESIDYWSDYDPVSSYVDLDPNKDMGLESHKGGKREDKLKDREKVKGKGKGKVSAYFDLDDGYMSEEDANYIQVEGDSTDDDDDYTDDDMEDELLEGDDEYTNARRVLRDKSHKGLCDELFSNVGGECGFSDYEDQDGDHSLHSSKTKELAKESKKEEEGHQHTRES